jgi:leucyl-tRNA synthetase
MLQPNTDALLSLIDQSYLPDYITERVPINKDIVYNESNIVEIIANVQDYTKLIEEFEKLNGSQNLITMSALKTETNTQKEIERLQSEMKNKLELFKKETYLNNNLYNTFKNETKNSNMNFDDTIKKMAEEIIKAVHTYSPSKDNSFRKKK